MKKTSTPKQVSFFIGCEAKAYRKAAKFYGRKRKMCFGSMVSVPALETIMEEQEHPATASRFTVGGY
ncbi:hypothetical protein OESDEN_16314 [Oesophagostomum dentatum]|uniref:Uncharacterized protein n=1 Tax=Oesophagostomum dentatum TaxID=61180 RepID=A0A0B1SF72_OESDE|nr:hypothetical protein OESDEN_16314 [Oesophagostomum dentatum]